MQLPVNIWFTTKKYIINSKTCRAVFKKLENIKYIIYVCNVTICVNNEYLNKLSSFQLII